MPKLLIITLTTIAITLLASLGVFIYLTNFTAEAQAKKVAWQYMQAVRSNNPESVTKLSKLETSATNAFFNNASLRDYRQQSIVSSDNNYYFLYSFTDDITPKKARLTISSQQVIEARLGDKLGATPDKDGQEASQTVRDDSTCLDSRDLAFIDSTDIYARSFRAMTMIFASNSSLDYAGQRNGQAIIDRLANFYERSSEKDYLIELKGYATDDPQEYIAMTNLAQKRADKIRSQLIKQAITPDRIQISKPSIFGVDDSQTDARYKMIDINIVNQCR